MTPLEITIENYYRTYLTEALDGAVALLPIICAHDRLPAMLPMISIAFGEDEGGDDDLSRCIQRKVFVRLAIQSRTEEEEATDPGGTSINDALAWLRDLQTTLQDDEAFRTHLLSLPEEDRTGAEMITRDVSPKVDHSIEDESNAEVWTITINHWLNLTPDDE
jgi:hypothetical protein